MDAHEALQRAIAVALDPQTGPLRFEAPAQPCRKSQRGVVVFHPQARHCFSGRNGPPRPFACDGSPACRSACRDVAVHAEERAILKALRGGSILGGDLDQEPWELVHVKVKDGVAVPSGPPSCARCSRLILEVGIRQVWLLHEEGLVPYSAARFHELSLQNSGLPAIRGDV